MPTNRITYNAEDVFFGSPKIEDDPKFTYISDHQILKRLNRVQSFEYALEIPAEEIRVLGTSSSIDRHISSPSSINISVSYLNFGIENEKRSGLYVQQQGMTQQNVLAKLADTSRNYDKKNLYLVGHKDGKNIRKPTEKFVDAGITLTDSDLDILTDPESPDFDILSFQNVYLSSYNFQTSVGQVSSTSLNMAADNMMFMSTASGVGIPVFEAEDATVSHSGVKFIVPKRFVESDPSDSIHPLVFRTNDIKLEIIKKDGDENSVVFHNEKVQNVSIDLPIPREPVQYIYQKHYDDRPIKPVIEGQVAIGFLSDLGMSGNIAVNAEEKHNYDFVVSFYKEGKQVIRYDVKGASLLTHTSQSAVGANKRHDLSFSFSIDLDTNTKGLFLSGESDYSLIPLEDAYGNTIENVNGEQIGYGAVVQY